jgi:predicted outer membrane repeat protein
VDADSEYSSARGESWDAPARSLQAAIDRVAEAGGGEVWVKAGVYKPAGNNRNATFALKPKVKLLGGFRGTETDGSQRNPKANKTILSGDLGKTPDSDNCYHVVTGAADGLLDGFFIIKGNANGLAENGVGAGVLLPKGTGNFSIANCIFERNNASWQGGGIYVEDTSLSVTNCMFFSNSATSGAGLATKGSTRLTVLDSFFSSNFALQTGGAMELQADVEALIERCSFMYNRAQGSGGAISAQIAGNRSARIELVDNIFNNNISGKNAGAIFFSGKFQPIISRCTFAQNVGKLGAGAIGSESGVAVVIEDCLFRQNKGKKGREDIGNDEASIIAEHREVPIEPVPEAVPEVAEVIEVVEQEEIPLTPKSPLPDVYVHREPDSPILLSSILSKSAF